MAFRQELMDKVHHLPLQPGVYIMKNREGDIIYIGKAKALKNRVSQYFQSGRGHSVKVQRMVENIWDFSYIVTDTEFEALVLECNLIKLHKPKYNILLKDDKAYPFIRIDTHCDYPRITMVRRKQKDGAKYYGPYPNGKVIRDTIDLLQKIFRIPTCSKKFPQDFGKTRPCLNYHIKRCMAPCQGNISPEEYQERFRQVISFIEGDCDSVAADLQNKMEQAAQRLEFEKAAQLRDSIRSISQLKGRQKVYIDKESDTDIIATYHSGGKVCITVLFIRFGKLLDKDYFIYPEQAFDEEGLGAFVNQFYHEDAYIPREILVDEEIPDAALIAKRLHQLRGGAVNVRMPKRGELAALLEMARSNSRQELESVLTKEERVNKTLSDLQQQLGLPTLPRRIESYDISNTGDRDMVAGMVVWQDGQPAKSQYRRFRIQRQGQDDYSAMKEVLYRRFAQLDEGNEKFAHRPDLILLDGGKGHLHAVLEMFRELGITVPVAGMVKDSRHRTRELVTQQGNVTIAQTPHLYTFIGNIQEEVHRYAISYHRSQRSKTSLGSVLEDIPGIGKVRREKLLKHFRGLKGIKQADMEQLREVLPEKQAAALYAQFHPQQTETEEGETP